MRLEKVIYQLYESDYSSIKGHEDSSIHQIDREIYLELDNENKVYVSWTSDTVQYSVGYNEDRWNVNEPDVIVDVSNWLMWRPLIGRSCEFIFHDSQHQILELRCSERSVYFSSQEMGRWFSDVLHISSSKPVYSGQLGIPSKPVGDVTPTYDSPGISQVLSFVSFAPFVVKVFFCFWLWAIVTIVHVSRDPGSRLARPG